MTGGFNARGLTWLFFPPGTLKNLPFYLKSRTTNGGAFIAWQIPNCPNGKRALSVFTAFLRQNFQVGFDFTWSG